MFAAIQKAIGYLTIALSIVPMIIEMVKAVELPGNGPAKLATIIEIVKAAWGLIPEEAAKAIGLDKIEVFVTKVVNVVVLLLNAAGVFKSGGA